MLKYKILINNLNLINIYVLNYSKKYFLERLYVY